MNIIVYEDGNEDIIYLELAKILARINIRFKKTGYRTMLVHGEGGVYASIREISRYEDGETKLTLSLASVRDRIPGAQL